MNVIWTYNGRHINNGGADNIGFYGFYDKNLKLIAQNIYLIKRVGGRLLKIIAL